MTPLILDDVRGSDTIRTIKARIEEETGIPSEKQGLICDDCGTPWPFTTVMKDDRSVASYELTFDNIITVKIIIIKIITIIIKIVAGTNASQCHQQVIIKNIM